MKIRYSTNWMGPVSLNWYKERGIDYDTEPYSAGRLDFHNPTIDSIYPDEMAVPPMRSEDWNRFGDWLDTFSSDEVLTLQQTVVEYEQTNPKIRWWKENE